MRGSPPAPGLRRLRSTALAAALLAASTAPLLGGCVGAFVAANAIPAVYGTAVLTGTERRDPFVQNLQVPGDASEDALSRLDSQIRAAECGDPQSQYRLAATLANGFNQTPDRVQVVKWYRLAERGGEQRAAGEIAKLEATMPQADVARARALADGWEPRAEGCPQQS